MLPVQKSLRLKMICSNTVLLVIAAVMYVEAKKLPPRRQHKEVLIALSKGTQCYNCFSLDNTGCWNPEHPDYTNITVPSVDCYMPEMRFVCIVITAESAETVISGKETGPVRARTCLPVNQIRNDNISYRQCNRLAKELQYSQAFTKVKLFRPKCVLCRGPLCSF